jgi:hypothetical protein
MTPENFCYWLQGLLEVGNPYELDNEQVGIIKDHLALVFKKEAPTKITFQENPNQSILNSLKTVQWNMPDGIKFTC